MWGNAEHTTKTVNKRSNTKPSLQVVVVDVLLDVTESKKTSAISSFCVETS